jgi:iron complex outermembrane receptor protein/hemoglobin/transferrin/lactoferrin receptor protein
MASSQDSLKRDSTILLNEGIVITAQRMATKAYAVTDAVVSLNREAMIRLSPMSTPDAMSSMAGVWMQKTNHGGGSPFIRGLTGYHTLLLLDGIRFNNSTFRSGPNQYLNTIDPLTLQRIEVLRGQGSVQYGSDGIGGVAHLFLREPRFAIGNALDVRGRLYGRVMDHDMEYTGRVEAELGTSSIAFLGGITYKDFGNIHAGKHLGTLKSTGYDEFSWDLKLRSKIKGVHLTAAWQHLVQNDVPLYHQLGQGKYSRYHFNPQQRDLGYIRLESFNSSRIFSHIRYTVAYLNSLEEREKQKYDDPVLRFERDNIDTYHAAIEIISDLSPHWKASSGIEVYQDRIKSFAEDTNQDTDQQITVRGLYPDGTTYTNLAAFTVHSIELNSFNFTLGGRYNFVKLNVSDPIFGSTSIKPDAGVWNAGVVYKATNAFHFITSANTGFRAPNVNDVASFGVADYRYEVPNFNLGPEKSFQYQAGLRTRTNKLSAEVFVYQNQLTNLIGNISSTYNGQDSLDGFKVYQKENINKARINGIEAEIYYQPNNWFSAFANYTLTKGDNTTRNEPLSRIPPWFGRMGSDIAFTKSLTWRVEAIAAGKQDRLSSGDEQDSRIPPGGTPGWVVVNSRLQFEFGRMKINTAVQNIFDKAYRIHGSGVDGIGRSFWVSLIVEHSKVHRK